VSAMHFTPYFGSPNDRQCPCNMISALRRYGCVAFPMVKCASSPLTIIISASIVMSTSAKSNRPSMIQTRKYVSLTSSVRLKPAGITTMSVVFMFGTPCEPHTEGSLNLPALAGSSYLLLVLLRLPPARNNLLAWPTTASYCPRSASRLPGTATENSSISLGPKCNFFFAHVSWPGNATDIGFTAGWSSESPKSADSVSSPLSARPSCSCTSSSVAGRAHEASPR